MYNVFPDEFSIGTYLIKALYKHFCISKLGEKSFGCAGTGKLEIDEFEWEFQPF